MNDRLRTKFMRIWKLEEMMLANGHAGCSVESLAQYFDVNRRTIYRDLAVMQELHIPIWEREARYGIVDTYERPTYRRRIIGG